LSLGDTEDAVAAEAEAREVGSLWVPVELYTRRLNDLADLVGVVMPHIETGIRR
jgi:hypothetical protein